MDLTPQFVLDKFLEFGRAIERVTGLVEKQNERIEELEERIEKAAEQRDQEREDAIDARDARRRVVISTFYEAMKGMAGAVVGALCTLALQHISTTPHK